jgi:hypothetical protein
MRVPGPTQTEESIAATVRVWPGRWRRGGDPLTLARAPGTQVAAIEGFSSPVLDGPAAPTLGVSLRL